MGFIIFSNLGDFNPVGKNYSIASLFITDTTQKKAEAKKVTMDSSAAILRDSVSIKKFLGNYIGEEGLPFSFEIKNNRLYYRIYSESNFLIKELNDTFTVFNAPQLKFVFNRKAKDTMVDVITPDQLYHLTKYVKDTSQSQQTLLPYTGTYYSPELDCKYEIILKDKQLFLGNFKYNDTKLTLVSGNHLTSDYWWINHLVMLRDSKNKITGFEVNSGRVMHVKFNKIN